MTHQNRRRPQSCSGGGGGGVWGVRWGEVAGEGGCCAGWGGENKSELISPTANTSRGDLHVGWDAAK